MGTTVRLLLALWGLFLLRGAFYGKHWGHGRTARMAIQATVGVGLVLPLAASAPGSRPWLVGLGGALLLPWRAFAVGFLTRRMRDGLAALALDWGTDVHEDPATGLVTVERSPTSDRRAAWAGNVLVHVRSLHPGVATSQTFYMMGFVVGLEREPAVVCSLMRGWTQPRYHAHEWRSNTTMQGQIFAMSMGDVLAEGGRATGGALERLNVAAAPADPRMPAFDGMVCDDPEAFAHVFGGAVVDALAGSAQGPQYECNVTPTSVNLFVPYCGPPQQRAHVAFLDALASAVVRG